MLLDGTTMKSERGCKWVVEVAVVEEGSVFVGLPEGAAHQLCLPFKAWGPAGIGHVLHSAGKEIEAWSEFPFHLIAKHGPAQQFVPRVVLKHNGVHDLFQNLGDHKATGPRKLKEAEIFV